MTTRCKTGRIRKETVVEWYCSDVFLDWLRKISVGQQQGFEPVMSLIRVSLGTVCLAWNCTSVAILSLALHNVPRCTGETFHWKHQCLVRYTRRYL